MASLLLYLFIGLLLIFQAFTSLVRKHRRQNLPPGPKPWPIIGNLNLLYHSFFHSIHHLSLKYGPIMHLHLGCHSAIIVSSVEMAKQFLKNHDQNFSHRPRTMAGKHLFYDYCNITFSPYGPYWRQMRKICQELIFSSTQLSSKEYILGEEMKSLLGSIFMKSGKPFVIKHCLSVAGFNVICRTVLGKKYQNGLLAKEGIVGSGELPMMLDELFFLTGVLNIGDFPWVNFLDLQGYVKKMRTIRGKFDKLLDYILDDIRSSSRGGQQTYEMGTFVDVLLKQLEGPDLEYNFTRKHIEAVIQDMVGGIETSTAVTEWAISELLKHPEILEKAVKELNKVIGEERLVEVNDLPNLPYIEAIMKETMRLHPVGPMLAPRISDEDCRIAGYDIPRKTRVFINAWEIMRSPTVWRNPEEFIPERFLGSKTEVSGQHFEFLPFGSGRRMCPAYNFGMKTVLMNVASLLHGFKWKLPAKMSVDELNMEEVVGLTMPRKVPLIVVAETRLSDKVYHDTLTKLQQVKPTTEI